MGLSKARDSNLLDGEKGDSLPILLAYPAAFRETAYCRWRRQATTLVRAVRAGRARTRTDPRREFRRIELVDGDQKIRVL